MTTVLTTSILTAAPAPNLATADAPAGRPAPGRSILLLEPPAQFNADNEFHDDGEIPPQ